MLMRRCSACSKLITWWAVMEIDALRAQYRAVAAGGEMRVAWISGHSGIGKSTLLLEAVARIRYDGALLVATSKGEEGRRGTPYAMLAQALEPLLQFVLGCADDEFDLWRARIGTAVAPVGRTLARFLPALSAVLGPQAPAGAIRTGARAGARRVLHAIARLIACFAAPERPLALLLDDLQWADAGTIQVLERLVQQHHDAALLLVGAYRGNEIDAHHPLRAGPLADVPDALTVELGPLNERATTELIAHALHQDTDALRPLSDLIGRRTGRNPFFVHHLLRLLADEGMLDYDAGAGRWRWNMARIAAHRGGDDVAMMLARQFELLPDAARFMLRLLACIGQRASTRLLATAAGLSGPMRSRGCRRRSRPAVSSATATTGRSGTIAFARPRMRRSRRPSGRRCIMQSPAVCWRPAMPVPTRSCWPRRRTSAGRWSRRPRSSAHSRA